jgi:hypothetical protein
VQQLGWQTREGRLTTRLHCRIDGDTLAARTDVRLSRLQLVPAASHDEAQRRIGLPLGLITTLMKDRQGNIELSFPIGGRLSDPRFEVGDAVWDAVRAVAINAITLPVSWIGQVRFTADSRIERIQVDPVTFEPGTATLTPQGERQSAQLVAFLDQLADVTLGLTPIVSSRDADALTRRTLEATLTRLARQHGTSREEAIAAQRLEMLRATVRRAGIETARLTDRELERSGEGESRIEIAVGGPEAARPSRLRDALRRLGVPLKGPDAR